MMTEKHKSQSDSPEPTIYQIRVKGHLGEQWRDWFEGMTLDLEEDGNMVLSGPVVDQAALHALLRNVRDLGMTLISVMSVNSILKPAKFAGFPFRS
jgi:hypothetical protein